MLILRYNYADTETEGDMFLGDEDEPSIATLERPWLPGPPGGMPWESCVPDGDYDLIRHARPNGDVVLALRNPDHGVYYSRENVPPEGGRTLILIHAANYVHELQGCLAPGLTRTIHANQRMVGSSRIAMKRIMEFWERGDRVLIIAPALGTDD